MKRMEFIAENCWSYNKNSVQATVNGFMVSSAYESG